MKWEIGYAFRVTDWLCPFPLTWNHHRPGEEKTNVIVLATKKQRH